jgi:hypothetical protein
MLDEFWHIILAPPLIKGVADVSYPADASYPILVGGGFWGDSFAILKALLIACVLLSLFVRFIPTGRFHFLRVSLLFLRHLVVISSCFMIVEQGSAGNAVTYSLYMTGDQLARPFIMLKYLILLTTIAALYLYFRPHARYHAWWGGVMFGGFVMACLRLWLFRMVSST